MKSWKKRWSNELSETMPPLRQDVKDEPLVCIQTTAEEQRSPFKAWFMTYKKRFFASVAACVAAIVAFCTALPLLFPTTDNVPAHAPTALYLEINPSVLFSVDEKGEIAAVFSGNTDADMILSEQARVDEIVGKRATEGVKVFVDYAAQLGYLDLNAQSAVRLSGLNENDLTGMVKGIEEYFCEKGAYVVVVNETLTLPEFCERAGFETFSDVSSLVESINRANPLYSERQVEGKTEEEVQSIYSQFVPAREIERLIQILELFGADTTALRALLQLPQTIADYTQKIHVYFAQCYENLVETHKEAYQSSREAIMENDYQSYVDGIIEEYGSLAKYWAVLRGN